MDHDPRTRQKTNAKGLNAARLLSWLLLSHLLWASPLQAAQAANDNLTAATILNGTTGTLAGSTLGASAETGEPPHAGRSNGGTVWYRWPVFTKGRFNVQAVSAAFVPVVAVYRQANARLTYPTILPVASSAVGNVTFDVEPGAVYMIAVASGARASGAFTLNWKFTLSAGGGPDLVLIPESVHANVITRGFSPLDCDVQDGCTQAGTNRILAISYDVANRGKEDVFLGDPTQSPWAIRLNCRIDAYFWGMHRYVLRDSKNQIVKMAEPVEHCFRDDRRDNPNAGPQKFFCLFQGLQVGWAQSTIPELQCHFLDITDLPAGNYSLEILIDPWNRIAELNEANNSITVPVVIDTVCNGPPSNDQRANATLLTGSIAAAVSRTECATKEVDERSHYPGIPSGRSVWFQWIAPYSGPVTLSTEGSSFDTNLEVQGPATTGVNGPSIASNDDASAVISQSRLTFTAVEGTNYWFVVDGFNFGAGSQGGRVILNLNPGANDNFAAAEVLAGLTGTASGGTLAATVEPEEPELKSNHSGGRSVWFKWIAPADGPVTWDTDGSNFPALLGAFTGTELKSLTQVNTNLVVTSKGGSGFSLFATAGETYWLGLDGDGGTAGVYQLHWTQTPEVVIELRLVATRESARSVRLSLSGTPGKTVQLMRSLDLASWTEVKTLLLGPAGAEHIDDQVETTAQAFYRAVIAP